MACHLGLAAAVAALTPLAACSDDAQPSAQAADLVDAEPSAVPVVLDYSPTVSDAGALLYLAAHSGVDLLAVTLPSTGEAECEPGVRITRALLTIAGRGDVPVGCGRAVSADGRHEWPAEWRAAANHLPGVVLPGVSDDPPLDAEELLADVLRASDDPVTVVAVAPLTNLASLLADQPELADDIQRIVTMGGAVDVPGNVEAAPAAEWNFHIDPASAREVLGSGIDLLVVPLDATDDAPWTRTLIARIAASTHPVAQAEHQVVTSHPSLEGIYLWDELAAVAAIDPSVVTTQTMSLAVDDVGALAADRTVEPITVATSADVDAATTELLRSLNGGQPLVFDDLTDDEVAYYQALARTMTDVADVLDQLDEPPASTDPREVARLLVESMWAGLDDLSSALAGLAPPDTLADEHAAFAEAVADALAIEDDLLAAITRAEGDDPWAILEQMITDLGSDPVDGLSESCLALEAHAVVRGGPDVCGLFAE